MVNKYTIGYFYLSEGGGSGVTKNAGFSKSFSQSWGFKALTIFANWMQFKDNL